MKRLACAAALLTVMLAFPAQAGVAHVPWACAATVYEVNVRQFSQDSSLFALKHANPALCNGRAGGPPEVLDTENDKVFAFRRRQGRNVVTVAVNLSAAAQHLRLPDAADNILPAWDYRITATH